MPHRWGNEARRGRATLLRSPSQKQVELEFATRLGVLRAQALSHYTILGGEGREGGSTVWGLRSYFKMRR